MSDALQKWNEGLEPIDPMIEYYAREMGQLAGRLMAALSLLTDLEDSYGFPNLNAQARETVHYSRLLVQSVLRIVAAAQLEQNDEMGLAVAIEQEQNRLIAKKDGSSQ
jgi:hypothetical protein